MNGRLKKGKPSTNTVGKVFFGPSNLWMFVIINKSLHAGGVAVCTRDALPEVLSRVGLTGQPTPVLLVQPPDELGLRSYPRDYVTCSLVVPGLNGESNVVSAKRWLVQLGFGARVEVRAEGEDGEEIQMPVHMVKMVCKLSPLRGSASGFHPAAVFMEQICTYVDENAIDSVIARDDGSCTFLCHDSSIGALLPASGCNGAFYYGCLTV